MKPMKLAPAFLVIPFALATLACPTRPLDRDAGSGGGGAEAGAPSGTGGAAGATSGEGGGAGSNVGGGGGAGATGGASGAAGGSGGAGGAPAAGAGGGSGGAAGAGSGSGGAAGAGGSSGGSAGAAGGAAGSAAGGGSGAPGGATGSGGTTGTGGALQDGQPCSLATNCVSRVCTPFYVDVDGDGYGAGQAMGFCGTTAPVGYSAQSGDCCDSATNLAVAKLIHPGAIAQTTSAGGVCGITWDYDCSGAIEDQIQQGVACSGTYPDCETVFSPFPDSACGQTEEFHGCHPDTSSGTCSIFATFTLPVACK